MWRGSEKVAIRMPREALGGTSLAGAQIFNFQTPGLWENKLMLFQAPGVYCFVRQLWQTNRGIARDGVAWSYGNCAWHFKELPRCFLECLSFLTVQFLYIIVNTCHCLSILAILMGTKWYLAVVLFCTSLMTHDVEHFPHIYLCFKNEIPE